MTVADMRNCENRIGHLICAVTWDNHKNACYGDSGGPLGCREHDKKWYLRGVVSDGEEKCKFWTVFTKVASFEKWITNITSRK